ncbi:unnamed protein product [Protopolystoma xenopodis]|uniref:Uncharacterized protein n=1 Tax=Protopolystoma xenopodis TaxID=117903 RepID=A0A448WLQ3_9PLAT|nr:unnamed protein product [Protopolystoma xenopodis]
MLGPETQFCALPDGQLITRVSRHVSTRSPKRNLQDSADPAFPFRHKRLFSMQAGASLIPTSASRSSASHPPGEGAKEPGNDSTLPVGEYLHRQEKQGTSDGGRLCTIVVQCANLGKFTYQVEETDDLANAEKASKVETVFEEDEEDISEGGTLRQPPYVKKKLERLPWTNRSVSLGMLSENSEFRRASCMQMTSESGSQNNFRQLAQRVMLGIKSPIKSDIQPDAKTTEIAKAKQPEEGLSVGLKKELVSRVLYIFPIIYFFIVANLYESVL